MSPGEVAGTLHLIQEHGHTNDGLSISNTLYTHLLY